MDIITEYCEWADQQPTGIDSTKKKHSCDHNKIVNINKKQTRKKPSSDQSNNLKPPKRICEDFNVNLELVRFFFHYNRMKSL